MTLKPFLPAPTNLVATPDVRIDTPPMSNPTLEDLIAFHAVDADSVDAETECMAKVVQHEAGNQPLQGQLAVAEVIVNRMHSGRFAATPCAVANQRGQFFRTESYQVNRASERWRTAVAVARLAQAGEWSPVAPGALFFHASYAGTGWARGHSLVAHIGGQIFYR